jgi:probable HAF family extracellular repeat protein
MVDLQGPLFQGSSSVGLGINDAGWVVGQLNQANGTSAAFLWRDTSSGMVDLNLLLDKSLGWDLLTATGINSFGQIVGYGIHNGQTEGYVLSPVLFGDPPVPEPSSLTLCGLAAATLGLTYARRRRRTR